MSEFRSTDFKQAMLRVFYAAKKLTEDSALNLMENLSFLDKEIKAIEQCNYLKDLEEALRYTKDRPILEASERNNKLIRNDALTLEDVPAAAQELDRAFLDDSPQVEKALKATRKVKRKLKLK